MKNPVLIKTNDGHALIDLEEITAIVDEASVANVHYHRGDGVGVIVSAETAEALYTRLYGGKSEGPVTDAPAQPALTPGYASNAVQVVPGAAIQGTSAPQADNLAGKWVPYNTAVQSGAQVNSGESVELQRLPNGSQVIPEEKPSQTEPDASDHTETIAAESDAPETEYHNDNAF